MDRERLEKQRAEQAVHKHFEESFRLAQQKVSLRTVLFVLFVHDVTVFFFLNDNRVSTLKMSMIRFTQISMQRRTIFHFLSLMYAVRETSTQKISALFNVRTIIIIFRLIIISLISEMEHCFLSRVYRKIRVLLSCYTCQLCSECTNCYC